MIRDNGIGISTGKNSGTGMGFRSLKEMTSDVGGRFNIKSVPYRGTSIKLIIPYHTVTRSEGMLT